MSEQAAPSIMCTVALVVSVHCSLLGRPPEMLLFDSSMRRKSPPFSDEGLAIKQKAWSCIVVKSSHASSHKYQGCLKARGRATSQMQVSTPGNQTVSIKLENQNSLAD